MNQEINIDETTYSDVVYSLVKNNSRNYNFQKVIEEIAEFQMEISKFETKAKDRKPPVEKIIEEFSHLTLRSMIYLIQVTGKTVEELEDEISEHITTKISQLEKYKKQGKYKGGL